MIQRFHVDLNRTKIWKEREISSFYGLKDFFDRKSVNSKYNV